VVWLLVYFVVYRLETETDANRTDDLHDLLGELLWAETSMWFLYALGVYFLVAKLLAPLPAPVVLGAATALALWSGWSGIEYNNKLSVLSHFAFFVLGSSFPEAVRRCGDLSGPVLWRLGGAYVAVFTGLQLTGLPWSVTLVGAGLVGIPLGLGAMAKVAAQPRIGPALAWIGQRTLRVYVLHFAVILAVYHSPLMITSTGLGGLLVAVLLPLVATAVVTATCLLLYELMVVHGCQHLFRMHPVLEAAHDALAALPGQPPPDAKGANVPRDASS
jgi:fucose 4-O-acetylase-like acetyltransferase